MSQKTTTTTSPRLNNRAATTPPRLNNRAVSFGNINKSSTMIVEGEQVLSNDEQAITNNNQIASVVAQQQGEESTINNNDNQIASVVDASVVVVPNIDNATTMIVSSKSDETLMVNTMHEEEKKKKLQPHQSSPALPTHAMNYSKTKLTGASLQLIDETQEDEAELKCGGSVMHTSNPNSGYNLSDEVKSDDDLLMEIELKDVSDSKKKDIILSPSAEEKDQHHKDESTVTGQSSSNKRYSLDYLMGFIPRWTFHPNKQSEARDLLAVERTQLAWVRTALSIVAIGIAVSKLLTSSSDSAEVKILMVSIGTIFVILGLLIFIYSFIRFQYATRRLIAGMYVADLFAPPFMFMFGIVVCILALALVFVN